VLFFDRILYNNVNKRLVSKVLCSSIGVFNRRKNFSKRRAASLTSSRNLHNPESRQ